MALSGLAGATELGDIALQLAPLHPTHDTLSAEVLLDLAADAIEESGATRHEPIEFAGIRKRYLAEAPADAGLAGRRRRWPQASLARPVGVACSHSRRAD
jgi:hypothetical protein